MGGLFQNFGAGETVLSQWTKEGIEDQPLTTALTAPDDQASPATERAWVAPTDKGVRGRDVKGDGAFGASRIGSDGRPHVHEGVDYVATPGEPVAAVTDGYIRRFGNPYPNDNRYSSVEITTPEGYVVKHFYVNPQKTSNLDHMFVQELLLEPRNRCSHDIPVSRTTFMLKSGKMTYWSIREVSYLSRIMNMRIFIGILLLLCFQPLAFAAEEKVKPPPCRAPELFGDPAYDDLVCAGIAMMARHDYKRAIVTLEKARSVFLFEWPNFMLFPRLALAYHEVGDRTKALEMLAKAELTLKIFTKLLICLEPPISSQAEAAEASEISSNWYVATAVGGEIYKIDSPYHDYIANLMCGDAYVSIYDQTTLEHVVSDMPLSRYYLSVKKKITAQK